MSQRTRLYNNSIETGVPQIPDDDAKAIDELLTAEREYVQGLKSLIDGFIKPLTRWADELEVSREIRFALDQNPISQTSNSYSPLDLSSIDVTVLSSNIEDILNCHINLMHEIESTWELSGLKGVMRDLKAKIPLSLTLHSTYLYNFDLLCEKLVMLEKKSSVATFIRACELQVSGQKPDDIRFRNLLMLPIHQVLHYHLIPALRNDHTLVALNRLFNVANRIIEESYKWAQRGFMLTLNHLFEPHMLEMISSQSFIKEGILMMLCSSGPIPFKFLLFREALLFGYETVQGKYGREQFVINQSIEINRCYAVDDINFWKGGDMSSSFILMSRQNSFVVTARCQVQKAAWFAAISGIIQANKLSLDSAYYQNSRTRNPSTPRGTWVESVLKKANIMGGGKVKLQSSASVAPIPPKIPPCPTYDADDTDSSESHVCYIWIMDEDLNMVQKGYMMPGLSLSDVGDGGSADFIEVLENPEERAIFRKHLEASHCSENLIFWEMVMDFRNNGYVGQLKAMTAAAGVIIHRFMQEGSPDQVNISSHMRSQVLANFAAGRVTIDIFEDSLRDVLKMLERDSFLHFCSSTFFAELLELRLMTPGGEPKERTSGVIKFHQLIPDKSDVLSPTSNSCGSARLSTYGSGRHGNFSSPTPKTPSTVMSDTEQLFAPFDDDEQRDPERVNILAAMDNALKKAAFTESWNSKDSGNHKDWVRRFIANTDHFPACISLSDMTKPGAPLIFVNREFCNLTGYSKEESVGKNCRFLQGIETEAESVRIIRDKLGKGQDCHVRITNYRKNGEKFQNLLSLKPVFDSHDIYRYVIGIQFEIFTDKTLKRRLNQLDNLLRLMPSKLQSVSSLKPRIRSRLELMMHAVGSDILDAAIPKGSSAEELEKIRLRDAFDMSSTLDCALNEAAVNKVWSSRASANAHEWLHKFMNSADSFPMSICVSEMTIPGNPIVFVNQAFCKLTGYSKDDSVGMNCRFLQGPKSESESIAFMRDMLGKGMECHIKITNYKKDGSSFQNLLCLKPVFDVYGIYKYVIGIQLEIFADASLKKRLTQLERLLSLIPGKLQTIIEGSAHEVDSNRVDLMMTALGPMASHSSMHNNNTNSSSSPIPRIPRALGNMLGLRSKSSNNAATIYSESVLQSSSKAWAARSADTADEWLRNFMQAAENFPASIVVCSMTIPGVPLVFVNDTFAQVTGYTKSESLGRNCKFLQGIDSEPEVIATICSCLSKGMNCHVKITNYRKNGEKFQNLLSLRPVYDINGTYRFVIGIQFEVVADKGLKKKLGQLDNLCKSIPNKLQAKSKNASQRCADFMRLAVGAASVNEAIMQGTFQGEEPEESRTPLGSESMLENALNMMTVSKGWTAKNYMDADDWLRNFISTAESFPACIVVSAMTQPGAPLIFVNHAFTVVTGYSKEESVGRNCRFLQGPETEPEATDLIRRTLGQGQDCHVRLTNYRKNGEKFTNLLSMKPIFDADGVYRYVIGVQFEVVADKGLKRRIGQLDKLLQFMPSKLMSRNRGNSESEIDLLSIAMATTPSDSQFPPGLMPLSNTAAALNRRTTGSANLEGALNTVHRRNLWGSLNSADADMWLHKFTSTIENFPASIAVSDMTIPGVPIVFVNLEFCRITGYSKEETVGRNCRFLQGPETEQRAISHIRDRLSKGQDCNVKLTNYRKNGEKFQNLLSTKPVYDAQNMYRFVVGVQFEIIEDDSLKRRLSQLERLLRLIPTRLEAKSADSNLHSSVHDSEMDRIIGQANMLSKSMTVLPTMR